VFSLRPANGIFGDGMFKKKKNIGQRIRRLFSIGLDHDEFYEELEDRMIEADIGARIAMELSGEVREAAGRERIRSIDDLEQFISSRLSEMIITADLDPRQGERTVYLFLGVNGVGKTTSMAKLARRWGDAGIRAVFAAGDTFRAAASEQLEVHAGRLGVRLIRQGQGADPSAVIYDAIDSAFSGGFDVVMADTAGRMHNKSQLIKELQKIDKVIRARLDGARYVKLLVIDATTGQNGIQQAEVFHEAVGIDGIILSKYDSRARGGLALSISRLLGIPFAFVGTGESYADIAPFDGDSLVSNIMNAINEDDGTH
jgi:fused signal recognition particle receptor